MKVIVLIDTGVYMNLLQIPKHCQDKDSVKADYKDLMTRAHKFSFLLPFATVLETGNHIGDLEDGNQRRRFAEKMVAHVHLTAQEDSNRGDLPHAVTSMPECDTFKTWLLGFPDYAMRNRQGRKPRGEGGGLSNLTIVEAWKMARLQNPRDSRVLIWSLDSDLFPYDTHPQGERFFERTVNKERG